MNHARTIFFTALAATLSLSGCGGGGETPPTSAPAAASGGMSRAEMVEELASTLQACSYDGKPVRVDPAGLGGQAPADCRDMVGKVMAYTGLPQNFVVSEGPVPNALAVILLDKQRVPQRVIAFNRDFMRDVGRATGGNPWAPVSIMAHEIGHHLSGHTITAGRSQPPIELEADKFSGYVLYKMGAGLADATRAMKTIAGDAESATHPARAQRLDAIGAGWREACRQVSTDCDSGAPMANAPAAPTAPQPSTAPAQPVALPAPDPKVIPFKYGRFVVDETGKLDPAIVAEKEKALYALASERGAEIVYLVVNDLRGMQPDAYALSMMRQLRVGKLDVGNGAVLVIAPRQRQVGVAMGPGIAKEAEFTDVHKTLSGWIDTAWKDCDDADGCKGWTSNLLDSFFFMTKWIESASWQVAYQGIGKALSADNAGGKLVRFNATVATLQPPDGIGQVNRRLLDASKIKYQAVGLKTDDGMDVIAYVDPATTTLMPGGALAVGDAYTMVGRLQSIGDGKQQASSVWLLSYDPTG